MAKLNEPIDQKYNLFLSAHLIFVLSSIIGSLYFSEVMNFPPCDLCWYQRICIYPMLFILMTGIYLESKEVIFYLLPLSVSGLLIAIYHNLIYYKVIEVIIPCSAGAPCTARQLNWLGFITIPLLALCTFITLIILNLATLWHLKKRKDSNEK